MLSFRRLIDGVSLNLEYDEQMSAFVRIQVNAEAYSHSNSQTIAVGSLGEAIVMDSFRETHQFSVSFICTDPSGLSQSNLRRYFSSREYYQLNEEWSQGDENSDRINMMATIVDASQTDYKTLVVTFQARFDTGIRTQESWIGEMYEYGGDFSGRPISIYNPYDQPGVIEITLSSMGQPVNWFPGTKIPVTVGGNKFTYVIGAQDEFGRWNQPQRRTSIRWDSTMPILGSGYYDYKRTNFFVVKPGEFFDGEIGDFNNPNDGDGFVLTAKLVTRSVSI